MDSNPTPEQAALTEAIDTIDDFSKAIYNRLISGRVTVIQWRHAATLVAEVRRLQAALAEKEASKNAAYSERDQMVAALSKLFPASLERHDDSDLTWENDWRWIAYIDLPSGQVSWHIHDSELPMFDHLKRFQGRKWDGHNTQRKYERLTALSALTQLAASQQRELELSVEAAKLMRDLNREVVSALTRAAQADEKKDTL